MSLSICTAYVARFSEILVYSVDGGLSKRRRIRCGDLSATSGAMAIRRDLKFGREFLIRRADRLVFGSDYFSAGQNVLQFELYRELDLPSDVQQKIFRDNARRLLGL